MRTRTVWIGIGVIASLVLAAGIAGAVPAHLAPGDPVDSAINYQGRLTDPSGTPLDGDFSMRFQVYDDPAAGTMQWDSGVSSVHVTQGLFNVPLGVEQADFNGQGLWLRIQVGGEWLSPRQALLPVPYALSLRAGAEIKGEPTAWDGSVLKVTMDGAYPLAGGIYGSAATGAAVYGTSAGGFGVQGYTNDGYAVYGYDGGWQPARGYGGYFSSQNGVGLYGYSSATSNAQNPYMPAVKATSANGAGVYATGASYGVRAESNSGYGVYGLGETGTGVVGRGPTGVWGQSSGSSATDYGVYGSGGDGTYAVHGLKSGTGSGLGVYGRNEGTGAGVSGYNAAAWIGTWGYSAEYNAIASRTGRADHNYGVYTEDNLYSLNVHTLGATMQVVQNGGTSPVELGDVVVIGGLGNAPAEGLPPIIRVQKAQQAGSTAILGVVAGSYARERFTAGSADDTGATGPAVSIPLSGPGPIQPGDYLLVVVRGPCQVKVDTAGGAIRPGDLLSSAGAAGYAAVAGQVQVNGISTAAPGTVFGKALEPLDAGKGLVYVYVTLQ